MEISQFTLADQLAFAKLSGDYNPIHVDPVVARRNLFGRLVVHGIHSVLWALNQWLKTVQAPVRLTRIQANFIKPIFLEEEITYLETTDQPHWVLIELYSPRGLATRLEVEWSEQDQSSDISVPDSFPASETPLNASLEDLDTETGGLDLLLPRQAASLGFSHVMRCLSPIQVAILLRSTYLVGMRCPGLNSLYSELSLRTTEVTMGSVMKYQVTNVDRRFNWVNIRIDGPGLGGDIKAFVRPTPQAQPTYAEIQAIVKKHEFEPQNALIVGGSRGLGEVVAKALAAGGAKVLITYSQGQGEAQTIVNEINADGQAADLFQLNVLDPNSSLADHLHHNQLVSHLYYFATPFIGAATKGTFSPDLFQRFCDFYITGLVKVVNQLKPFGLQKVFCPSTVYIDELPANMGEYVAAKIAAESLCQFLSKTQLGTTFWCPRLPRMATDQTISLVALKNEDPLTVMLAHLRQFKDL
jgi:NADP-dependent 3-hydroxy acid dehydrogenase YdfG